ncbi:MAG: PilZ domain-containing protein [Desulfovermiculus sp.]
MVSIDALATINEQRKVRLQAVLRQGQGYDFWGMATILSTQESPLVRIVLDGKSGQDRPSARDMDPEGDFSIRLGLGIRAATVRMRLQSVESDDHALFVPTDIELEEQNRDYFRVQTSLEIRIRPRADSDQEYSLQTGRILDISGGGMLMETAEYFAPGTILDLDFGLENNDCQVAIACSAAVVRCTSKGRGGHETAVEFRDLPEEQRDVIMSYCFARQREQVRDKVQVRDLG